MADAGIGLPIKFTPGRWVPPSKLNGCPLCNESETTELPPAGQHFGPCEAPGIYTSESSEVETGIEIAAAVLLRQIEAVQRDNAAILGHIIQGMRPCESKLRGESMLALTLNVLWSEL